MMARFHCWKHSKQNQTRSRIKPTEERNYLPLNAHLHCNNWVQYHPTNWATHQISCNLIREPVNCTGFTLLQGCHFSKGGWRFKKWYMPLVKSTASFNFVTSNTKIWTRKKCVYLLTDALLHEWGYGVYLEANNLRVELNRYHQGR